MWATYIMYTFLAVTWENGNKWGKINFNNLFYLSNTLGILLFQHIININDISERLFYSLICTKSMKFWHNLHL